MRLLLWALLLSGQAQAWGPIGHRVVAEIAQRRLTPQAAKMVEQLLDKETLADVANWADFIRSDPNWSKAAPWHYVSIEDHKKYRDVAPAKGGDVIWAVEHFSRILSDKSASTAARAEALKFLVHFIGDLHQPLHVGRSADRGGNTVSLKWFGRKTNLHEIWDEKLIEMEQLSYTEYVALIDKKHPLPSSEDDDLLLWIRESQSLRDLVYTYPKKVFPGWEYEYRFRTRTVLNERLLKAGLRLGLRLNRLLN